MFQQIWAFSEIKKANQEAAEPAKIECEAAYLAWRQAPTPRPPELRQAWDQARAALKEARAKPRQNTGPASQKRYLDCLSAALGGAVTERLITQNWAKLVVLPKYERPQPLVWTDERVARWRETGEKPGPVMVWIPEQTGQFLDAAVNHPMYIMWHLMVYRAPRRGEATGLSWTELDLTNGVAHVSGQLVTDSNYNMWQDTPKSRSGRRAIALDYATLALLTAWRDVQKAQRVEWEEKHRQDPTKYGPHVDYGYVYTRPDGRPHNPQNVSQALWRFIQRIGLPPVRLHDLRHCAASLSLAAGLSMKAIQALLGHSSYQLTADTYTSLLPQFEQAAANAPLDLVPRRNGVEKPTDEQALAAKAHPMQLPAPVHDEEGIEQGATTASVDEETSDRHLRVVRPAPRDEALGAA
ncbi:site-specific integrase [Streptomyces sp. NPDC001093]|uniref:site-specific integrase n=1 Tax=Streptomyces sp. NPDC001093 TaxID=3154376 RepID=UPI00331DD1C9